MSGTHGVDLLLEAAEHLKNNPIKDNHNDPKRRLEVDSISNPVLWEESVKRFKEVILETKLRVPQLLNPEKLNSIPDDAPLVIQAAKNAIEELRLCRKSKTAELENLKKENETSRLRIEKLEDEIISKTPKSDQARMKKTLGEIELDSKLSIRSLTNTVQIVNADPVKSPQGQKRTRCMSDVPGIKPGKKRPREDINRRDRAPTHFDPTNFSSTINRRSGTDDIDVHYSARQSAKTHKTC